MFGQKKKSNSTYIRELMILTMDSPMQTWSCAVAAAAPGRLDSRTRTCGGGGGVARRAVDLGPFFFGSSDRLNANEQQSPCTIDKAHVLAGRQAV